MPSARLHRAASVSLAVALGMLWAGVADSATSPVPATSKLQGELTRGLTVTKLPVALAAQLPGQSHAMFTADPCAENVGDPVQAKGCEFGRTSSPRTLVIYGDSHALQWIPALSALGSRLGFRVLAYVRVGCQITDVTILDFEGSVDAGCASFRSRVVAKINALRPAPQLVLLVQYEQWRLKTPDGGSLTQAQWNAATQRTYARIHPSGAARVTLIGDPVPPIDPSQCLAANLSDVQACTVTPNAYALYRDKGTAGAAARAGVAVSWIGPLFCRVHCPDVAGGMLIHAYYEHVSAAWARHVAPALGELVGCAFFKVPAALARPGSVLWSLSRGPSTEGRNKFCAGIRPT